MPNTSIPVRDDVRTEAGKHGSAPCSFLEQPCWSRNRDHLDGNTKGNGSGTWNVLLCYNLKSDISSSQQCLSIKHYKQLNPMGSTHVHPHHLLLKHTLILCWHKQYLKESRVLSIKKKQAYSWQDDEQNRHSFHFIQFSWYTYIDLKDSTQATV